MSPPASFHHTGTFVFRFGRVTSCWALWAGAADTTLGESRTDAAGWSGTFCVFEHSIPGLKRFRVDVSGPKFQHDGRGKYYVEGNIHRRVHLDVIQTPPPRFFPTLYLVCSLLTLLLTLLQLLPLSPLRPSVPG